MRLYPGGPIVQVQWYFTDPGALWVPQPNFYTSSNFDEAKGGPVPSVGEIKRRAPTWSVGNNALGLTGKKFCGSVEAWQTGGRSRNSVLMRTDAQGLLPCCETVKQLGGGGFGLGGTAWPRMPVQIASGGLGLGGSATQTSGRFLVARGGLGLGGSTDQRGTQIASGGLGLGGEALQSSERVQFASGGLGLGGEALQAGGGFILYPVSYYPFALIISGGGHIQTADGGLGLGGTAEQEGDVPIVGEIRYFFSATPPTGWLYCDGSAVSQSTYSALYALYGSTFGPAVGGNFTLPDFRARKPMGGGAVAGLTTRTPGQAGGLESVQLSAAESGVPAHTHAIGAAGQTCVGFTAGGPGGFPGPGVTIIGITATQANAGAAASTAHTNMDPWLCAGYWHVYSGV